MNGLRKAREDAGFTQCKLAKALGVSSAYLSMIESGKRKANLKLALKISEALNRNIYEIFSPLDLGIEFNGNAEIVGAVVREQQGNLVVVPIHSAGLKKLEECE